MKKNIYKLNNIDCSSCALKIEDKLNKLEGVSSSSLNYILLKLSVTFDETIVNDEEIELCIHKSLSGVKIVKKNNADFIDEYKEQGVFKKILFRGKKNYKT